MKPQEARALLLEWSKTWAFYKSNVSPLLPGDRVSQAVLRVIGTSCPQSNTEDGEVEGRGLALKILGRIAIGDAEVESIHSGLCRIARYDRPVNVVLAIRCMESLLRKSVIDRTRVSVFVECLAFSARRSLPKALDGDAGVLFDQLLFASEFARAAGLSGVLMRNLVHDIEAAASILLHAKAEGKAEQSQTSCTLQRLLALLSDAGCDAGPGSIIEKIVLCLIARVRDDSRELRLRTYDRISAVAEKNIGLLRGNFRFFTRSRFLDVRAFGIKCLLKALRHRTGFASVREELLGVIQSTVECAAHNVLDTGTLISLLESLRFLNRQYLSEGMPGWQVFLGRSITVVRHVMEYLGTRHEHGKEISDTDEGVVCAAVVLLEDVVAASHGLESLSPDTPIFGTGSFCEEDLRDLDELFRISLCVFSHGGLRRTRERFYRLFLYTDIRYFSFLVRKHSCAIAEETERHEVLFDMWRVYLEEEKSAFAFGLHMFSRVMDQVAMQRHGSEFALRALGHVTGSRRLGAHQLEKIILSRPLIRELDRAFDVVKLLFDAIRPLYSSLTAIPKVLYEATDGFLDTLRKQLREDPSNDIYIHLALNIPLSITLAFQHFVKIAYFVAEAFRRDGEVLRDAFSVFEASLDLVSTEVFSSVSEDILVSIVESLIAHSRSGLFALAATQILAKLHSPMKKYLQSPTRVVDAAYPGYDIFLVEGSLQIRCDSLIRNAVQMVRGDAAEEDSPWSHVPATSACASYARTSGAYTEDAQHSAVVLLQSFLLRAFGWPCLEEENMFEKASRALSFVVENQGLDTGESRPTHKSSHYARIAGLSSAEMNRYHHYVYDALLGIFRAEDNAFLECVYSVLVTCRITEKYYHLGNVHTRVYFDYDFLMHGLCEAFSLYNVQDCSAADNVFGKNISNANGSSVYDGHLCSILTTPYRMVDLMYGLAMEIGLSSSRALACGLFDDILEILVSFAFFKRRRKQCAAVLGIAAFVQLFGCKENWASEKLAVLVPPLLFYMGQERPRYRHLVLHTLLYLVEKACLGMQRVGSDVEELLFESLSSPFQDLRNTALAVLRCCSRIRGVEVRDMLEPYSASFCKNISTKTIGCNLLGLLDCLLFVTGLFPQLEIDPQLAAFMSASLASSAETPVAPENALLRTRGQFYLLRLRETEEATAAALESICKHLVDPIYENDMFIESCREMVQGVRNRAVVASFSNRLVRASFHSLHSERTNVRNNLCMCLAVLRIFPADLVSDMAGICVALMADCSGEVFLRVARILAHFPRIVEADRIALCFRAFLGDVDTSIIALIERHVCIAEALLDHLDSSNVLELLVQMLQKSMCVRSVLRTQTPRLRQLASQEGCQMSVHAALLLSHMGHSFEDAELFHIVTRYSSLYHAEYMQFMCMNAARMTHKHMNTIYSVAPHVIFDRKVLDTVRPDYHDAEYTETVRDAVLRNACMLGDDTGTECLRHDIVFERMGGKDSHVALLDSNMGFSEAAYLFRHRPTPELFTQLALYSEAPSRILEALKAPALDPETMENAVLGVFGPGVSYKTHLMVLIPLLTERPELITCRVLPKVVDAIHRLFGTASAAHKLVGGRLLLAAYRSAVPHASYGTLFTHLFNFCVATASKELVELYREFDLDIGDDIDLEGADTRTLAECLAHEISRGKSVRLHARMLAHLSEHIGDSEEDVVPVLAEHLFRHCPNFCIERMRSTRKNPFIAYHLLVHALGRESMPDGFDHELVLGTLEGLLDAFVDMAAGPARTPGSSTSIIDLQYVVEKYPFSRDTRYLAFLGRLASHVDDFYVFEEIIAVMETMDVESLDFLDLSKDTESFLNFVVYIFRSSRHRRFYENLQKCFVRGLQSHIPYIRNEFHQLFEESLSLDKVERLKYLMSFDWNMFEKHWTYTFLRQMVDGDLDIRTPRLYAVGSDTFYEGIYTKEARSTARVEMCAAKAFAGLERFRKRLPMYVPPSLRDVVLDVCFHNENACLELLLAYLKSLVRRDRKWVGGFEKEFRGFAHALNTSRRSSAAVEMFLSVFSYFVPDVRVRHGVLFAGLSSLSLGERNKIYKLAEVDEFYYGSFTAVLRETDQAIHEMLLGNYGEAQRLILKAGECLDRENFSREEAEFMREEWKKAAKNLAQWDMLYEVSASTKDHTAEAESYFVSRGTGPELQSILAKMERCYDRFVFECICDPRSQDLDSALYLGQRELAQAPLYTPQFSRVLSRVQAVVELGEKLRARAHTAWARREPFRNAPLAEWAYFYSFRECLFGPDENDSELQHELARTLNRITDIAIKRKNWSAAGHFGAKVFAIKNIRPTDAFEKICNELEMYLQQGDREQGLRRARMVNVGYFTDEQRGTVFGYIARFGESDSSYRSAVHICPTNSWCWFNWGQYLERKAGESAEATQSAIENIFVAFLHAAVYSRSRDAFKPFIRCLRYFEYERKVDISRHLRESIRFLSYHALSWFCCFFIGEIVEKGSTCSELCLDKLCHHIPQAALRLAQVQIDRLLSPALHTERSEASARRLQSILGRSRFESSREQLGLTVITSFFKKKMVFTLEETAYALLDSIFSTAASQIEGKIPAFDLRKIVQRVISVAKASCWNPDLLDSLLDDFSCESMTLVELALKTYRWLEIIENILRTYVFKGAADVGITGLTRRLGGFRVLMFGRNEYREHTSRVYIDHFRPAPALCVNRQLLTRSLTAVGSDGKDYVYSVTVAGSGHRASECNVSVLAELIDLELELRPDFYSTLIDTPRPVNLTSDVDLVAVPEPVVFFGDLLEDYLFKTQRTPKKILFEYLAAIEELSGEKMYPGLERLYEYVDQRSPHHIGRRSTEHAVESTEAPAILGNNKLPTKQLRLKAFRKITGIIRKNVLSDGFEELYGDSHTFFVFKRKSIQSYALVSAFAYAMFMHQHHPSRVGIGVFSAKVALSSVLPFTPDENDYFRLTQNIQHLFREEGLEGVFAPLAHRFAVFMNGEDFVKVFIELMFRRSYSEVASRLSAMSSGKIREIMNESSDPENLCMQNILWHPWL